MKGWREYVNVCFEKMWQEKKKQMKRWLTTELQDTSSLMRTMTSCVKVPGHRTWDTSPLAQASWAVNFLPLSSISLAYSDRKGKKKSEWRGNEKMHLCYLFFVQYYWRSSSFISVLLDISNLFSYV